MYEGIDIKPPEVKDDDLEDLSATGKRWALEAVTAGAHETVLKSGQWVAAVKAYMACISFVDAQIGKMLDALEASPNGKNTVIVVWGDHGWHLGEKQHWGKWTGWQRATHVPLIIVPPRDAPAGTYPNGAACREPVSLLDLYPTLIDLCGLPPRPGLSGRSLTPLLRDPEQNTNRTVLTTFDKGNYSVTGTRWHYLHYADGAEELYDWQSDANEWTNRAADPKAKAELDQMRVQLKRLLQEAGGRTSP